MYIIAFEESYKRKIKQWGIPKDILYPINFSFYKSSHWVYGIQYNFIWSMKKSNNVFLMNTDDESYIMAMLVADLKFKYIKIENTKIIKILNAIDKILLSMGRKNEFGLLRFFGSEELGNISVETPSWYLKSFPKKRLMETLANSSSPVMYYLKKINQKTCS